jgi:hypothetical protein
MKEEDVTAFFVTLFRQSLVLTEKTQTLQPHPVSLKRFGVFISDFVQRLSYRLDDKKKLWLNMGNGDRFFYFLNFPHWPWDHPASFSRAFSGRGEKLINHTPPPHTQLALQLGICGVTRPLSHLAWCSIKTRDSSTFTFTFPLQLCLHLRLPSPLPLRKTCQASSCKNDATHEN